MYISSALVGTKLAGRAHKVTYRETMNYAAAVGDDNRRYFNDVDPQGLIAPPLFAVALTWPMLRNINGQMRGALGEEVISRMVHASEHLIFHRAVAPGDQLFFNGEVAAIAPTTVGTLMYLMTRVTDRQYRPVFTETTGALFRGVTCEGPPRGQENLPKLAVKVGIGDTLWEEKIPVERFTPHVYDGCTNIIFPIHTSLVYAKSVGLPDIILQGTAALAFAAREIVNHEAGGDPERLAEIACRFTNMILPGTSMKVQLLSREPDENKQNNLFFQVLNHEDEQALSMGYARVR